MVTIATSIPYNPAYNPWPAICLGLIIIVFISAISFVLLEYIGEHRRKNNPFPPTEAEQEGTGSISFGNKKSTLDVVQTIAVILMSIGLSILIVTWIL